MWKILHSLSPSSPAEGGVETKVRVQVVTWKKMAGHTGGRGWRGDREEKAGNKEL